MPKIHSPNTFVGFGGREGGENETRYVPFLHFSASVMKGGLRNGFWLSRRRGDDKFSFPGPAKERLCHS